MLSDFLSLPPQPSANAARPETSGARRPWWPLARRVARRTRLLSCWVPLLLAPQWCSQLPATQPLAATLTTESTAPQPDPLPALIRALLDTTAAGSPEAADAQLGLAAGPDVRTFYGQDCIPGWLPAAGPSPTAALRLLARAAEFGLRPTDYATPRLLALHDSLARNTPGAPPRLRQQARFDVALSDAVLRFMRDLSRGRLRPYTVSAAEKAAGRLWQPAPVLRAALAAGTVPAAMLAGQPTHREYRQLQQALAHWLARPPHPDSATFHRVQYEHAALNLERWRWNVLPPDSDYVLINIPAYELLVVAHDSVVRRHRVVVGKPETPTPTLSSQIRSFTLAPDWHVPRSIATKEILPHLRDDAGYLARNELALYDARGRQLDPYSVDWSRVTAKNFAYSIRQGAGCENALGNVVFRFANPYAVYLHDTPMRQYFDRPDRALSHGCIRLQHPLQLAAYLLRREGRPVRLPSEEECARQPRPRDVRLRRPLPLHIRYATCTAENGHLRFLPDIYHRDEAIRRALFGPVGRPRPVAQGGQPAAL
ncbi:hypothetical protein E5K00_06315 [Hymenobacter aquaticus]|uniref:L,D-TPase catalytic domain-containing protein n=1 Tax=Hymenobacter aquaticus TaxID=1867101 RepID=A0A4Z0Q5C9_9BACT|nr:L,D-transpeptidase family protein [Hymenobacter aquaticus]TGE24814.1 hypothetical protein E5K00_06315 [Hymenobacter aquaticus]